MSLYRYSVYLIVSRRHYRSYLVDYSSYCTSLVETTISSLIVGMNQDGTLPLIYQSNIDTHSDTSCEGVPAGLTAATSLGFSRTCQYHCYDDPLILQTFYTRGCNGGVVIDRING
jgi:hypothetical protein